MIEAIALKSVTVLVGAFFGISGYHKLFNARRRVTLRKTIRALGVNERFGLWAVPVGEVLGGAALIVGFLTPLAALGLLMICSGALCLEGFQRVRDFEPLDKADWLDDVLYLPETLYTLLLVLIGVSSIPAPYSVDALLIALLNG